MPRVVGCLVFSRRKGLTLADARCPRCIFDWETMVYSLEGPCNGENTTLFGSKDWNRDEDIDSGRWGGEGG